MEYQISNRISQFNEILDDVNYLRVLLFLDEYNPDVLLTDLEKNLNIDNKHMIKIVADLIDIELVKKQNDMYQLTELGKLTMSNLKNM